MGCCALILLAVIPATFSLGLRAFLQMQALRAGATLTVYELEGSLFHPIVIRRALIEPRRPEGVQWRVELREVTATFAWRQLGTRTRAGWFESVRIDGIEAKAVLPEDYLALAQTPRQAPWLPLPARVEIAGANATILRGSNSVRVEQASFTASSVEAGEVALERLVVTHPWLKKTFADIGGTTAIHDRQLVVGGLRLDEHLVLETLTVDLEKPLPGALNVSFKFDAFGGAISGDLATGPAGSLSGLNAVGLFSRISIAQLAAFLGTAETAGGTIREGNFRFGGEPISLRQATMRVRLDAVDFQWGARRWQSLILGAELIDRRLEIPELRLVQAGNTVALDGHILMDPERHWWQSEFSFNVAARIDSLAELSALFGPEFSDMSGKVRIDGSVRGAGEAYAGQLVATGSDITWRGAPLDAMRAAARIQGNEIQVSHLEFLHGDDYIRCHGVVNILGRKRYWGEVKSSIANLALYQAILRPPIAPRPFAGGLHIDWSGDGDATAHSGAFKARLRKVRGLDEGDPQSNPIDAEIDGSYSPGNVFLSRLSLADSDTALAARVIISPRSVELQNIRLQHAGAERLHGEATLPFNVWSAWSGARGDALWDLDGAAHIAITATKLELRELALLSGRRLPVEGRMSMNVSGDGALHELRMEGRVTLQNAAFPALPGLPELEGVDAELVLDQRRLVLEQLSASALGSAFTAAGQLDFSEIDAPVIRGEMQRPRHAWKPHDGTSAQIALALRAEGPLAAARVTGAGELVDVKFADAFALESLLQKEPPGAPRIDPPFRFTEWPLRDWQFDFPITGSADLSGGGTVNADLAARGDGGDLALSGLVSATQLPAGIGEIQSAALLLGGAPRFAISASGDTAGHAWRAIIVGPAASPATVLTSEPPLDDEALRALLAPAKIVEAAPPEAQ